MPIRMRNQCPFLCKIERVSRETRVPVGSSSSMFHCKHVSNSYQTETMKGSLPTLSSDKHIISLSINYFGNKIDIMYHFHWSPIISTLARDWGTPIAGCHFSVVAAIRRGTCAVVINSANFPL